MHTINLLKKDMVSFIEDNLQKDEEPRKGIAA